MATTLESTVMPGARLRSPRSCSTTPEIIPSCFLVSPSRSPWKRSRRRATRPISSTPATSTPSSRPFLRAPSSFATVTGSRTCASFLPLSSPTSDDSTTTTIETRRPVAPRQLTILAWSRAWSSSSRNKRTSRETIRTLFLSRNRVQAAQGKLQSLRLLFYSWSPEPALMAATAEAMSGLAARYWAGAYLTATSTTSKCFCLEWGRAGKG